MKGVNPCIPNNLGWLEVILDDEEMDFLWKMVKNPKKSNRDKLAGNISASYYIEDEDDWFSDNVLDKLCDVYAYKFKNLGARIPTSGVHSYQLRSLWVNYQKQTEFNPIHNHTGVYSFVVWMKIPTDYKEQSKLSFADGTNSEQISNFQIEYRNILGQPGGHVYEMSPEMEGRMLFFPSELQHHVFPFYNCKKDRISISGNIVLDTK